MTSQSAASQPEREKMLVEALGMYSAPQRMRKRHKDLVKKIISLKQGYDGNLATCFFCGKLTEVEHMQLHHVDHIESHNTIDNLRIAHQNCNNVENARYRLSRQAVSVSEIKGGAPTFDSSRIHSEAQGWTSREGEKHDQMRHKWNAWLVDLEKGPFAKTKELYKRALAKMAPHALGLGSSVTYNRYIDEDVYGGILDLFIDDNGIKTVRLAVKAPETEKTP